jgi:DNA-binding response OmpR family regulator
MTATGRTTVLVVEDDAAIRRGLADALAFAGYGVVEAADGQRALELAVEAPVDLVLLDLMLPRRDGFEVLGALRRSRPTLPVIMVTARGAEEDRVRGLSDGADDYVVKPFSARELLARVDAVLRRSPQRSGDVVGLRCGAAFVDLMRREVRLLPAAGSGHGGPEAQAADAAQPLTEREAGILRYLAANRSRAVDRRELLQHVWGLNPRGIRTRTVDMHVARLREKVEEDPARPRLVLTVRGRGYMLGEEVQILEP